MSKKHVFLQFFSKIAIFACVFCTIPAWSETTCDIDYTPVTGNSWQTGNPTPTNPVAIESIGTKVGNKYAVQIAVNYDGGVVDLGSVSWTYVSTDGYFRGTSIDDRAFGTTNLYCSKYTTHNSTSGMPDKAISGNQSKRYIYIRDDSYTDEASFKQSLSGVMLYYQRTTDENWTAPTLKTVYLDEPLRKVGNYADVLDYKNGTITRNVGVKVLDGTEDGWTLYSSSGADAGLIYNEKIITDNKLNISLLYMFVTHFQVTDVTTVPVNCARFQGVPRAISHRLYLKRSADDTLSSFKSWLASQYAAGTPVIVYYPLETPVVEQIENWSCTPPITDIKIATTKYVESEFAPLNTALENAISVVDNVVTQTIAQAGQIATLQNTKQTRPSDDNECPANMKCLLVTDESGTPHWYPIIEP